MVIKKTVIEDNRTAVGNAAPAKKLGRPKKPDNQKYQHTTKNSPEESANTKKLHEVGANAGLGSIPVPMGRPTKYTPDMCQQVIELGAQGKTLKGIAARLGITHETLNDWRKTNKDFSLAIKTALALSQEWWEELGQLGAAGQIEGFNATSFIFNMKNRFREDYTEIRENRITGADGGPVQVENRQVIDMRSLNPEAREAMIAALEAAVESDDDATVDTGD